MSKVLYNIDLKIVLFELRAILRNIFLFVTIVASSFVLRAIARVISVSQKQFESFIISIVIDKSILLFKTIFCFFNIAIKFYAIANSRTRTRTSIILNFIFKIKS